MTWSRSLLACLALGAHATVAQAQLVRGTVTERGSGVVLGGVVVSLEPVVADGTPISVLSGPDGTYGIRGPAGQYRLTAKRIGVQRYESEPFALEPGETRAMDVVMDALVYQLPSVRIVDASLCITSPEDRERVTGLWDEARTALTATALSRRDRLFQGSLTRYTRKLDPRSLRVLEDSWGAMSGLHERTFVGPSGDSLSRGGYWRIEPNAALYYAPDGEALLSRAFQRDHCFGIAPLQPERDGLVGLSFEPVPGRMVPDVRGVLWLDDRTFALQFVEFAYTGLPSVPYIDRVGGELRFSRLANGAWVTSRWYLRMPEFIGITDASAPVVMTRPTIRTIIEEGGMAFGPGLRLFTSPATIAGTLRDSLGQPLGGAEVQLSGTPYTTITDAAGAFRLDSLPAGSFVLVAAHPSYAALGVAAVDERLALREGEVLRPSLRAASTTELATRLCPGQRRRNDRAIVRVIATDSVTSRPLANLAIWLRWAGDFVGRGEGLTASNRGGSEVRTDVDGRATFCDVPANMPLTVSAVNALGRPSSDAIEVRASGGTIHPARLRTRRP